MNREMIAKDIKDSKRANFESYDSYKIFSIAERMFNCEVYQDNSLKCNNYKHISLIPTNNASIKLESIEVIPVISEEITKPAKIQKKIKLNVSLKNDFKIGGETKTRLPDSPGFPSPAFTIGSPKIPSAQFRIFSIGHRSLSPKSPQTDSQSIKIDVQRKIKLRDLPISAKTSLKKFCIKSNNITKVKYE